MRALLDTHTFLWQRTHPERVSKAAMQVLNREEISLFVSAATLWEIGILASLKRIEMEVSLSKLVEHSYRHAGISVLAIDPLHVDTLVSLPFFHRDPFDRLLVAQAKSIDAVIVSKDSELDRYGVRRIW